MARDRYLITEGHPDTIEPEFVATATDETLEATLHQAAERIAADKGDVSALRVWELTAVEVTTKAFDVLGLEKVIPERVKIEKAAR